MKQIKLAVMKDAVIQRFVTATATIADDEHALVIQPELDPQPDRFWKANGVIAFATSAESEALLAAEQKKKDIVALLQDAVTEDDLIAIKADISNIIDA